MKQDTATLLRDMYEQADDKGKRELMQAYAKGQSKRESYERGYKPGDSKFDQMRKHA